MAAAKRDKVRLSDRSLEYTHDMSRLLAGCFGDVLVRIAHDFSKLFGYGSIGENAISVLQTMPTQR